MIVECHAITHRQASFSPSINDAKKISWLYIIPVDQIESIEPMQLTNEMWTHADWLKDVVMLRTKTGREVLIMTPSLSDLREAMLRADGAPMFTPFGGVR